MSLRESLKPQRDVCDVHRPHDAVDIPPFRPHALLSGGHAQTLAGFLLPTPNHPYGATKHTVTLPDDDVVILHDDRPASWREGDRTALMLHGLSGCHQSGYMVRIAAKLNDRGVRTFRMDLRTCGAGRGLSRYPYHAGRSEDALAALGRVRELCPSSPTTAVGFSLGGNVVLKLLGEKPDALPASLDSGVAVNPPIDLQASAERLDRPNARLYDRHFVNQLLDHVAHSRESANDLAELFRERRPRGVYQFDDFYTAPLCGFGTAANYYAKCSSAQFISHIQRPTLIVMSRDDPMIPVESFELLAPSDTVKTCLTDHGGHLGYVGRSGNDPDRRWMDWRVVDWVTADS